MLNNYNFKFKYKYVNYYFNSTIPSPIYYIPKSYNLLVIIINNNFNSFKL